ncbi:MAG: poly(3-hydroxybutyrate) depolymerase [Rubrivivax sp.]|nr:MAG: poly(3-hydroxybutyrate) depolymerase [Rubrivivax sp.]
MKLIDLILALRRVRVARALLASHLALGILTTAQAQPEPAVVALPALGIDAQQVTVSGLSSGAYMAAQFEVAYSASIRGAGVMAGGPYACSQGSVGFAATRCSCPLYGEPGGEETAALVCRPWTPAVLEVLSKRQTEANRADIDDPANLRRHRVWLFSGGKDRTVDASLVDALENYYTRQYKVPRAQVHHEHLADAGHGMPVLTGGVACPVSGTPFLNNCGLDGAGALLKWLYPRPRLEPAAPASDALIRFDQSAYSTAGEFSGLDDTGWAYVPRACRVAGAHCRLHVVFHGCRQGQSAQDDQGRAFGTTFVEHAGYNRWAEGSRIVVLYPQVAPSGSSNPADPYRLNPKGCWDFWGYTSPVPAWALPTTQFAPPFARRQAPQMRAVKSMIDALARHPVP